MADMAALEKRVQDIDAKIQDLQEKKRKAARALEAEVEKREAERVIATMSDSQKRALLQVVNPKGIKSEEALGTPGGGNG